MIEDKPTSEHTPAEDAPTSIASGWYRTTRRTVLGGAGAGVAALLAACGVTKKPATSVTPTAPDTVKNAKLAAGTVPTQTVSLMLNDEHVKVDAVQGTMLLYVLRDQLGQHGPKFGCGLSECGACAVLLDGKQIRSCVTPLESVKGRNITTLDGLGKVYNGGPGSTLDGLHPLQQAWIDEQVPQCGYCQSGMIIQAADLLSSNPNPTVNEIKEAMNGHLCRCGTYNSIVKAIQRAAAEMA